MAWVRIHDGAMTHPKLVNLSDKAFRLWVWGLAHSQQHLTDGLIEAHTVPNRLRRAVDDLIGRRLWERHDVGYKVHDYLDWNDSRDKVRDRQAGSKRRLDEWRERKSETRHGNAFETRLKRVAETQPEPNLTKPNQTKPDEEQARVLERRAGRLREESYPAWYAKHRHGARLRLVANSVEFQDALALVRAWSDEELEKLAAIFLTTDDDWISRTDRGFRVFALKASWCDDRLKQWEAKQRREA